LDLINDSLRCAGISTIVHTNGISAFGGEAGSCGADASAGSGDYQDLFHEGSIPALIRANGKQR
jgi:hypothetical protein